MSIYRREIDAQCCNQWMNGIRTINGQYPDDNRDFDINAGSGITIQPATGGITIINSAQAQSFVAGDNIEITPSGNNLEISLKDDIVRTGSTALTGDVAITGDLQVNGDIVQQGSAYETHAEKVFTANDYITMRDRAVAALAPGDYSGFQVEKYDGTNDGRLVIDRDGTARVGDVGDEQPLMTRDESANLTNGNLLEWDAANSNAVDSGTDVSTINTAINGKVSGTGNIGSDAHPIKVVNGVATPVIGSTIRYARLNIGSMSAGSISSTNANMPLSENLDPTSIITVSNNTITITEAGTYFILVDFQVGEVGSSYFVTSGFYNSANTRIFYGGDDGCVWDHHINYGSIFTCEANAGFTVKISGNNVSSLICRGGTVTLLKLL